MNSIMKICGEQKIQDFDIIPLHLEQFKGTALVCTKNDKYIVKWNDELSYLEYKFHKNFAKPSSLAELETQYEISRFRIAHEFTAAFGQSPIAYLNGLRLKKACELLTRGDDRIGEISTAVGFENANHFINLFRRQYGMTPGTYRKHYHQHITSERRSASELPRG